jgi:hypothetical protein
MLVRAQNRYDAYDQMNAGMLHIYRETIDTSLRLAVDAMKFLGYRTYAANRAARMFLKYDESKLKQLASIRDREEYINTSRSNIEELERLLQADASADAFDGEKGWDDDSLMTEVRSYFQEKKEVK